MYSLNVKCTYLLHNFQKYIYILKVTSIFFSLLLVTGESIFLELLHDWNCLVVADPVLNSLGAWVLFFVSLTYEATLDKYTIYMCILQSFYFHVNVLMQHECL